MVFTFRKVVLSTQFIMLLLILSVAAAVLIYMQIFHNTFWITGYGPSTTLSLILVDLILFLIIAVLVVKKIITVWTSPISKKIGSSINSRIVMMFSLIAAIPTVIIVVSSTLFFNFGIQAWFDKKVGSAIEQAVVVAEAYLKEHKETIRSDIMLTAHDIEQQYFLNQQPDQNLLVDIFYQQMAARDLTEIVVFEKYKKNSPVLVAANSHFANIDNILKNQELFAIVDSGEIAIIPGGSSDVVRAVIKLQFSVNHYLMVGRFIDNKVLNYIQGTKGTASEYDHMRTQITNMQVKFLAIFVVVAILLLLVSVSSGIILASTIIKPINKIIDATKKLRSGDLTIKIEDLGRNDEINILARTFNQMTSQLFGQRQALVQANMELEARRQFGEIVLAGVSTGIMVLDKDLCITLINPSGLNMFATSNANFIGKPYNSFFRETKHLLDHLLISDNKEIQKEIAVVRNNIRRNFLVKIATELFKDFDGNLSIQGYIVTFDDITDLLAAQWTEVARRVAHEIKNPLTPIKLAAERLRKKYVTQVKEPEVLERYTNTVIRHVDDINSIVEEFSNFVRMPKTLPIRINIAKLVHDIFLSHQCLSKSIGYSCNIPSAPVVVECDVGQITRLLNNIIKNAEEAIDSSQAGKAVRGNIHIDLVSDDTNVIVTITDNGKGFAEDILERATEPYVTTRSKGTGLGLAIVEKIVQEHNGSLTLANNTDGVGAHVKVELPLAC